MLAHIRDMNSARNFISLHELSERTGVEARTLRSWVSDGLLAGPDKIGRGALYPESNIDRVHAVLALKGTYSMSEIARIFMVATADQIEDWAAGRLPEKRARSAALDYLRSIKGAPSPAGWRPAKGERGDQASSRLHSHLPMKYPDPASGDLAAIERLVLMLDDLLSGSFSKRARGETWTRISVTRDIELSIRGSLLPDEQRQFELLAGQLGALLTGRIKHE